MARLKHKVTGVTVDVSDEFAAANQGAWEPATKTTTRKTEAKSSTASKSSDK